MLDDCLDLRIMYYDHSKLLFVTASGAFTNFSLLRSLGKLSDRQEDWWFRSRKVWFENDQFARILGYGNLVQGNLLALLEIFRETTYLRLLVDLICIQLLFKNLLHQLQFASWQRLLRIKHSCGIVVENINGKKYILVIVDDYFRYTWTHFMRSKDETLEVRSYHVTPKMVHSLFQGMKRYHITSSMKGNQISNFLTSLAAHAT
ncbi:retrovirus-related pol polyprotein from transposon TNT 1-94 [Tanacetum coccineum]